MRQITDCEDLAVIDLAILAIIILPNTRQSSFRFIRCIIVSDNNEVIFHHHVVFTVPVMVF